MRTKKSFYNVLGALIGQTAGMIAQFIGRLFFLRYLSATYLGLSGVFGNVLSVLSLVELGAGTALTYSLYKPLAEGNVDLIKSLMRLYRKIYFAIGVGIFFIGLIFTPIYPYFMSEIPDIPYLTIYYWIFVINTAVTYFYSYKRVLIICDQKKYINSIVHYGIYTIICIAQSLVLYCTKSYLLFLLCVTVFTIIENITITQIADKLYPYLRDKKITSLPKSEVQSIKRNISSMMLHKIGGIVVSSTDNILISKFLGLIYVGTYANYLLITDALSKITLQFFQAITASIGNLLVEDDLDHIYAVFKKTFFASAWIFGFCSVCLIILFQPFIRFFAGEKYLLNNGTVLLICINFYLIGMRKTVLTFRDASATYYYDRYKAIAEAVINLALSIILVQYMGISGVFLGTTLSMLLMSLWIEPLVLYNHILKKDIKDYFAWFGEYTIVNILICCIVVFVTRFNFNSNILEIIWKGLICTILYNGMFIIIWWGRDETKYFVSLALNVFKRRK